MTSRLPRLCANLQRKSAHLARSYIMTAMVSASTDAKDRMQESVSSPLGLTNVRMIQGKHSYVEHNIFEGPKTKIIGLYGSNTILFIVFGP